MKKISNVVHAVFPIQFVSLMYVFGLFDTAWCKLKAVCPSICLINFVLTHQNVGLPS